MVRGRGGEGGGGLRQLDSCVRWSAVVWIVSGKGRGGSGGLQKSGPVKRERVCAGVSPSRKATLVLSVST